MMSVACRWPDGKTTAVEIRGPAAHIEVPEMRCPPVTSLEDDTPLESIYYSGVHRFTHTNDQTEDGRWVYDWRDVSWSKVTVGPFGEIISIERLEELPWANTE